MFTFTVGQKQGDFFDISYFTMSQKSISSFFGKRKRIESDDIKANAKKLHLDCVSIDTKKVIGGEKTIVKKENADGAQARDAQEGSNKRKQADIRSLLQKVPDENKKNQTEERAVEPAYQKYAHLVASTTELPLPFKFSDLFKFFEATDNICSMMTNQNEDITFNKLKVAVENVLGKNFSTVHLGKMISVMPKAYSCEVGKIKDLENTSSNAYRRELIIKLTKNAPITSKLLKKRKEEFYRILLEKIKDYHEDFLKNLNPPLQVNRDNLKRWHPDFMVSDVPDIIPKELPQPPVFKRQTAKSVLARAREFLGKCSELQNAIKGTETTPATTVEVKEEIKKSVEGRLNEQCTYKFLQDKLRAKKTAENLDKPTSSSEENIGRLFATVESLRRIFFYEKRSILRYDSVIDKVHLSSTRNLSKDHVEQHIKLLIKHLSEWISVFDIRGMKYLKINKNVEVSLSMLSKKLKS